MVRGVGNSTRQRGSVRTLPSGSLQVRVYTGIDPITKKPHYLTDVVPAGPGADDEAEKVRAEFVRQVDERRSPRTNATLIYIVRCHIDEMRAEKTTRETYEGYADKHIEPFIGQQIAKGIDGDDLDSFYAELERCREHCDGTPYIQHRTKVIHKCDHRCRPHECRPLAAWTVRKIHFIISGAYKRACKKSRRWLTYNPADDAEPPVAPPPNPQPPTAEQTALIIKEAWRDLYFGTLVWCSITTGSRRGELCALRWRHFEPDRKRLCIGRAMAQSNTEVYEKDTKTHQVRYIALDDETVAILLQHKRRCERRARKLGIELSPDAFIFAKTPDGVKGYQPRSLTQKYARLVKKLGIKTTLHKLRHYSATELILAGVDVRTVAGRLGHSGGGTTTLKIYAAWKAEADQKAAAALMGRMPGLPVQLEAFEDVPKVAPENPFEKVAARERSRIIAEDVADGSPAPTVKELSARYGVSVGTAHRALVLLKQWGMVSRTGRGVRPVILRVDGTDDTPLFEEETLATVTALPVHRAESPVSAAAAEVGTASGKQPLQLEISGNGLIVAKLVTSADPTDFDEMRRLLVDALRRKGYTESSVGEFEMDVRPVGSQNLLMTFVA